jgi:hypothetical protein
VSHEAPIDGYDGTTVSTVLEKRGIDVLALETRADVLQLQQRENTFGSVPLREGVR